MKNFPRHISLVLALALAIVSATSQTLEGDSLLNRFDLRFDELHRLIFPDATAPTTTPTGRGDLLPLQPLAAAQEASQAAFSAALGQRVDAEAREIKSQTGLALTGQTYYRLDEKWGIDDGDDPVSTYLAKIQLEARWHFLQSALFKSSGRIRERQLQADIERLDHERSHLENSVYLQKEAFHALADQTLAGVLLHRIANLSMLVEAQQYLLDNENISSDELLTLLNQQAEAERTLVSLTGEPSAATDLSTLEAYTVEVDTTALLQRIASNDIDLRILAARIDLIEQQARNVSYWRSVDIAPFVRYSYYVRNNGVSNSKNLEAGVAFNIPINREARRQRDAIRARKMVVEQQQTDIMEQARLKIQYIVSEIDRLNRALRGEVSRIESMKRYLAMREEAYRNVLGHYSRLDRMKEYNSYLTCLEKLVEYQYRRDCLIADLQVFTPDISILTFCTETPLLGRHLTK